MKFIYKIPGSRLHIYILCFYYFSLAGSCKKFTEVGPPENSVTQESVYSDDQTAIAVLTGLYARIQIGAERVVLPYISVLGGLSADEYGLWPGADVLESAYYTNSLSATTNQSVGHEYWNKCYEYIYTCNSVIEGISTSSTLSSTVKTQLLGEATFLRAFVYFYLINLYGDAPLAISIDYETNRLLPRSPVKSIYQFIVNDLKEAQENLSSIYLNGDLKPYSRGSERVRPTKWAAIALLARAYLYIDEYNNAVQAASELINNSVLFNLSPLTEVFLKNNPEAIWQLQGVEPGFNTQDARIFNLNGDPIGFDLSKPVFLSSYLLNAFEKGDDRKKNWIDVYYDGSDSFYFPSKYKIGNYDASITTSSGQIEYQTVLRLVEQYLIRAEANAKKNNLSEAIDDINVIRARARSRPTLENPDPLPTLHYSLSQSEVLKAIEHERQVELFSEWGHRWLDLKRTNAVASVMKDVTPHKGGAWEDTDKLYPLPLRDLLRNPNLAGHQNPGY